MSKYAEQIARIDERTETMLKHLEKLNSSQGQLWALLFRDDKERPGGDGALQEVEPR